MAKEVVLRPVGELFKGSIALVPKIWKEYLLMYLLTILGLFVLMAATLGYPVAKLAIENPNAQDITPEMLAANWPYLALGVLVFVLYAAFVGLALNRLVYLRAENKDISIKEAFSYSSKNFINYLWISLLAGLLVVLGFLALILPGFYVLTIFSMTSIIFVLEEKRGLEVLKRSNELVSQKFWAVFGRLAIWFLVLVVLSGFFKDTPFVQTIVNFVTSLVSVGYLYYIYKDLSKK